MTEKQRGEFSIPEISAQFFFISVNKPHALYLFFLHEICDHFLHASNVHVYHIVTKYVLGPLNPIKYRNNIKQEKTALYTYHY